MKFKRLLINLKYLMDFYFQFLVKFIDLDMRQKWGVGSPQSSSMLRSGWSRLFSISLIWGNVLITLVTLLRCPPSLNPSVSPSPPTGRGIPVPDGAAFLLFQPRPHLPTLTPAKDNLNHQALPTKTPTRTTDANHATIWFSMSLFNMSKVCYLEETGTSRSVRAQRNTRPWEQLSY